MEIIPVIHVLDDVQVYKNIDTCVECGIQKIFLICHSDYRRSLVELAKEVKSKYKLWVGINLLGVETDYLLTETNLDGIDGLWCDDGLSHLSKKQLTEIKGCREFRGMFFGGLAFKYQNPNPSDLASACENSKFITNVSTTSGNATGSAPTRVKIENIRNFLGNHPMAIASGISVDNINSYKDLVQYVLVASSITDTGELINKNKLLSLIEKNN